MAGNFFIARTSGVISLSSGVEETLLLATPAANVGIRVLEIYVALFGTDTGGDKWRIQLARFSADLGGTTVTVVKDDKDVSDTVQCSFDEGPFGSDAEQNTVDEVIEEWALHPQDGLIYPFSVAIPGGRIARGGDRVGIHIPSPAATLDAIAYMKCEE